ncbi:aminotransferase class V-fold PLP-dependent enzyme [Candidatus Aminicenantes bacterium AC-335-A11]|nr:aminotransferase class V-fold PLP-dependent enzyme [Candidatus Aminicenantes bacterium AC-335-A11]
MSEIDVKRVREETPACKDVVHFNNAGASLMPIPVAEALHEYLKKEEKFGGYETAELESESLENFYHAASRLLNCEKDEIAFTENATRAWEMIFYSFRFQPGDKILTTISEYGSNVIAYNQQAEKYGAELIFVPNDEYGQIDLRVLENLIDERVKLISINHVPTGNGLVNPAKEIGKIAKSAGIPYLLDATQSIGQIPIDVKEIGCDALCGTGRKYLRGPRATGLLYVRKEMIEKLIPPFLDIHSAKLTSPYTYVIRPDAKRFETWEQFMAGKVALGVAIDYALSWGIGAIQQRIYKLASELREKLAEIDGVVITDKGKEKCGIVTFIAHQMSASQIKKQLAHYKINVSVSGGSGNFVLFQHRGLKEVVRASVHYYNTSEEIDYFMAALKKILINN